MIKEKKKIKKTHDLKVIELEKILERKNEMLLKNEKNLRDMEN